MKKGQECKDCEFPRKSKKKKKKMFYYVYGFIYICKTIKYVYYFDKNSNEPCELDVKYAIRLSVISMQNFTSIKKYL